MKKMKNKNILIITDSIQSGGAERSLCALLNAIDFRKINVSLLYFYQEGNYYLNDIPDNVKILIPTDNTQIALSSQRYVFNYLKTIKDKKACYILIFKRLLYGLIGKIFKKNYHRRKVYDWQGMKKYVENLPGEYDVAIAYMEKNPVYYLVDKVQAKKKIAWQRTDYKLTGCNPIADAQYFEKLDAICVLSTVMKNNFKAVFPQFADQLVVLPNLIDTQAITRKANVHIVDEEFSSYKGIRIVSVGTLRDVKRYDTAISACQVLKHNGVVFRWYIIGSGEKYKDLIKLAHSMGVDDSICFLGNKKNPYPYMKNCDLFVQCSEREGFSTTVFEAKCLKCVIVASNAPGISDQIVNGENGVLFPVGEYKLLAKIIQDLVNNKNKMQSIKEKLYSFALENANVNQEKIDKFYKLLGVVNVG